ncbi:MAG: RluA family pseudouridine synthase [Wenzhouxiangellaceae bacterium]
MIKDSKPDDDSPALTRVREVEVDRDGRGQRLDNFLLRELGSVPRSAVYKLIRTGQVRVNGRRARPMQKLVPGDRVRIPPHRVPDSGEVPVPRDLIESIRARIVHRQAEYLVVDKPAGLAAQGGTGLKWGLAEIMRRIDERAVPVHRLDRETSGLMVFALGAANARALQRVMHGKSGERAEKRYLALLEGHLPETQVVVDQPLMQIRDGSGQRRVVVDPNGQDARSVFRVLERFEHRDFVEVQLMSGRMHQIRVHAQWLGCPVVGDPRYGDAPRPAGLSRMFLHAASLRLPWPDDQLCSAPLPDELNEFLARQRPEPKRSPR